MRPYFTCLPVYLFLAHINPLSDDKLNRYQRKDKKMFTFSILVTRFRSFIFIVFPIFLFLVFHIYLKLSLFFLILVVVSLLVNINRSFLILIFAVILVYAVKHADFCKRFKIMYFA